MKKTLLLLGATALGISTLSVQAATEQLYCTLEYMPVCGTVVENGKSVQKTFGNRCEAGVAKAVNVVEGECANASLESPQKIVEWAYDAKLTRFDKAAAFGYDRAMSRQEAAAFAVRAGQYIFSKDYNKAVDACRVNFTDKKDIDSNLDVDVKASCGMGLFLGNNGNFYPKHSLTHAEALMVLVRMIDGKTYANLAAYTTRANELGLTFANLHEFNTPMKRGQFIEWIKIVANHEEAPQILSMTVAPEKVDCGGVGKMQCLRVQLDGGDWQNFSTSIEGFSFEPGYSYELQVRQSRITNPPADGSSIKYTLEKMVKKSKVDMTLVGDWQLKSVSGFTGTQATDIEKMAVKMTLGTDGKISAKICNTMGGNYSATGGKISAPNMISTLALCDGLIQKVEDAFQIDGASYTVVKPTDTKGGTTTTLSLTTKKGVVFTFVPVSASVKNPILGDWKLIGYNNIDFATVKKKAWTDVSLKMEEGKLSGKICNNFSGNYTLSGTTLATSGLAMTRMLCMDNDLMKMEESFGKLDGATVTQSVINTLVATDEPYERITIKTKSGDTFTFGRK